MSDPQALISDYLDDRIDAARLAELEAWILANPAHADRFAEAVRIHDRLSDLHRAAMQRSAETELEPTVALERDSTSPPRGKRSWKFGLAMVAAVIAGLIWLGRTDPLSAASQLDRLIERSAEMGDRVYRIRSLDATPEPPDERRPPIDGAILHVRRPDRYVLIRSFPDGRRFITGSDGDRSWSIPPRGAVRVSADPLRFRGPVPGQQHGIPFADLRLDLVQLREAYRLTALPIDADGLAGILALKRSSEYRGPARVELRHELRSGVIKRMRFQGMPRQRGGPDEVSVELVESRDLGRDFFRHESHHGGDRRIIEEE
jgi:hypothetical protein